MPVTPMDDGRYPSQKQMKTAMEEADKQGANIQLVNTSQGWLPVVRRGKVLREIKQTGNLGQTIRSYLELYPMSCLATSHFGERGKQSFEYGNQRIFGADTLD